MEEPYVPPHAPRRRQKQWWEQQQYTEVWRRIQNSYYSCWINYHSTSNPLSPPLYLSHIYIYIYDHIYKQIILLSNSNPTSDSKGFSFFFFLSRNHQELERDFREESRGAEMLQLFFAVAFSSVPLTLYIPPLRSLNLFVETMEDIVRETSMHTDRLYPRVRQAFFRILDCMLCNNMR